MAMAAATLRLANYNPLTIKGERRGDVEMHLTGHIVALQGTQVKHREGASFQVTRGEGMLWVDWGRGKQHKATGVAISVRRPLQEQDITEVLSPPPGLQGRGGLLWLKSKLCDRAILVLYLPTGRGEAVRRLGERLLEWASSAVDQVSKRSELFVLMDANSPLGEWSTGPIAVKLLRRGHTSRPSWATTSQLCRHGVREGQRTMGRLGFICGSKENASRLEGGIDYRAARTLQVIPSGSYRDHLLVKIRVPVAAAARAGEEHAGRLFSTVAQVDRVLVVLEVQRGGCGEAEACNGDELGETCAEERRQWVAAEFMLWMVGRQLDRARRLRWRKLALMWEAELHEAWIRRDLASCHHRLSLLIAGKSKRAKWRSVAGQVPEKQQWADFLAKEGCEGGMKAHEVDFEGEIIRLHGELDGGPRLQAKHVDQAREDCDLVGRYMVGATKRKCPPAGSPPLAAVPEDRALGAASRSWIGTRKCCCRRRSTRCIRGRDARCTTM